ncbi:hypothetical protein DFAR_3960007 [Desulfarculales bacterium]
MPAERLSMRKIKEVLRLQHEAGCGNRDIAKSCGIGRTTVSRYLHRTARAGLSWPLPTSLDETQLEGYGPSAAVERAQGGPCLGLPIQLVLRASPGMVEQAGAGHASGAPGRLECGF